MITLREKIACAALGAAIGLGLFVALPMYFNYQERGCVFLVCN